MISLSDNISTLVSNFFSIIGLISLKKFNSSSGGSAVNVAYLLGAKRIILLGFDMRFVDGKSNWWQYDQFPKTDKGYANFIRPFYKIKEDAYKLGVEILNATPSSALDMFRFVRASEYIN